MISQITPQTFLTRLPELAEFVLTVYQAHVALDLLSTFPCCDTHLALNYTSSGTLCWTELFLKEIETQLNLS